MTIERPTIATETGCAYGHACALEKPLERIRNLSLALDRIAGTLDDADGAIVQELTSTIDECLDEIDKSHTFFFRLHHPDRAKFERDGWPDEPEQAAAEAT